MDLIWMELHGYRRFEKVSKIILEGNVIALIGPNEAGKSSVLAALAHLNSAGNIATGVMQETTRDCEVPKGQKIIECHFILSDADRDAIAHLPGGDKAKWFNVAKDPEGALRCEVRPQPYRELGIRKETMIFLKEAILSKEFLDAVTNQPQFSDAEMRKLLGSLDAESKSLPPNVIDKLKTLKNHLDIYSKTKNDNSIMHISEILQKLADHEQATHPHETAIKILLGRKPKFLLFSDEDRDLESSHDLSMNKPISPALNNLAKLANLDLKKLRIAIPQGNTGQIETLTRRANEHLDDIFKNTWSQSNTSVNIRVDGWTLHVLVRNVNTEFTSFAERSDGLRSFVALLAFVSTNVAISQKPILLIDEAERHLHYDAQADLVQMLTKQDVVAKVVYTTHSAGCLPEDLGMGVRLIQPVSEIRSEVKNWFWDSDAPGFSPLLFGMGASSLAFVPVRRAMFTEGATDFILLPALFREAADRTHLGFQIVPGLSQIGSDNIPLLRTEASHVVFLVDADDGGKQIVTKLKKGGIPENHILQLPDEEHLGLVLEDFIDPEVYKLAVNRLLSLRYVTHAEIKSEQISDANRPDHIKRLCESQSMEPPSRRQVAYQILEQLQHGNIVYERRSADLKKLYDTIINILNI